MLNNNHLSRLCFAQLTWLILVGCSQKPPRQEVQASLNELKKLDPSELPNQSRVVQASWQEPLSIEKRVNEQGTPLDLVHVSRWDLRPLNIGESLASLEDAVRAYRIKLAFHCDNLANADTVAYKCHHVELGSGNPTVIWSRELKTGSGVHVSGVIIDLTPGPFERTNRSLDVAIDGDGFFKVTLPNGGGDRYTRDGSFRQDASGSLVTADGYELADGITIPEGGRVSVGSDGSVSESLNGVISPLGQLTLYNFPNPAGLSSEGGNLYAATDGSGLELSGIPGQDGFGLMRGGFLERSNVDLETERRNLEETVSKLYMFEKLLRLQ